MTSTTEQKFGGGWKRLRGKLRETWGTLTDDDLDKFEGKRDQLVGYLEQKTGESRDKIKERLDAMERQV